jgi:AraC-like DNA-binding protein
MDVVAVLPDATLRARLTGALRGRGSEVRFCATVGEARVALAGGAVRALVVGACDAEQHSTAPLVERARRDHPHVTVVGYCALTRGGDASAALVGLIRAGVHTVVMRDLDDEPHALRTALQLAEHACAAALVLDAVRGELPPGVRPLVELYLRGDERPPEVGEAARALGVHRRTLVNRMRAAGCPPPRALRTWCRVFVAARLLEAPGRTVESVAHQLEFDSPSGLRNTLRRYTGRAQRSGRTVESVAHQLEFDSPSGLRNTLRRYTGRAPAALRTAGGLRCALSAFAAACAARRVQSETADAVRRPRSTRRVSAPGAASTGAMGSGAAGCGATSTTGASTGAARNGATSDAAAGAPAVTGSGVARVGRAASAGVDP